MAPPRAPQTRRDLTRILGLPESASDAAIRSAAERLLSLLRRRHAQPGTPPDSALADEITALDACLSGVLAPPVTTPAKGLEHAARTDRRGLAMAMLVGAFLLALLVAYASGYRIVRHEGGGFAASLEEPAKLVLLGRLPGATLRVLDSDREELFVKIAAEGAVVELDAGRYALEVSREDCPDIWTRSVYFEAGATHQFEPFLCVGEGTVTVRSNVTKDRLLIDGFDVGATGAEPHTLGVGDHEVRVEKTGYQPFEARIRIKPDEALELRAELFTGKKQGSGLRPNLPTPIETPGLAASPMPEPEPFDLGDLQQQLAPRKSAAPETRLLSRAAETGLPDGGSTAWHDRVSQELLGRFDSDGSGLIDQLAESEAISCALWLEIERDFDRGGLGLSLARYYGFDGSEWHSRALGFDRSMRGAAYTKMMECGLQK